MALPMPLPSCGNRFAPKMTITIARMMSSSGKPIRPMMKLLLGRIVPPYARVFVSIFLICLCLCEIRASTTAQFTSGVDLVEVYASVTDARGVPVLGLTRNDFLVEEDGQQQEIRTFSAGDFPLALAVGIDRSFSMARVGLSGVANAIRSFLAALRPDEQTMLVR